MWFPYWPWRCQLMELEFVTFSFSNFKFLSWPYFPVVFPVWIQQESLKYRLLGSEGDIGSWGHEYVRWNLMDPKFNFGFLKFSSLIQIDDFCYVKKIGQKFGRRNWRRVCQKSSEQFFPLLLFSFISLYFCFNFLNFSIGWRKASGGPAETGGADCTVSCKGNHCNWSAIAKLYLLVLSPHLIGLIFSTMQSQRQLTFS